MKIDTSSTLAAYQASKTPSISKTSDDAKLKEQTDAFEAILLKFMLDTSLNLENPLADRCL